MNTPDDSGVPSSLPSPGVTTGAAHAPTLPTGPDFDVATLARQLMSLANTQPVENSVSPGSQPAAHASVPNAQLPAGPIIPNAQFPVSALVPNAPPPTNASAASPPAPASAGAPEIATEQSSATSRPAVFDGAPSPFHLAPSFDRVFAAEQPSFSVPLVDAPAATTPAPQPMHVYPFQHEPVVPASTREQRAFEPNAVRAEFPILRERVNGKPLVWLDNAATTQKPQAVIDRLSHFYSHENSNIHRAAHTLAARATTAYEGARESVRRFINARSVRDIVFVRGATEGINLVAKSWGSHNLKAGDEIVITWLEHHANIVPWQQLAQQTGARLLVAPVDDTGQIMLDAYAKLLGPRTRLVALTQVSNALGTITPAVEMVAMAHRYGAKVLVDGAQAVSHMPVDVQALGCDFYVFSGHKVFAPTGIGVVCARSELLDETPPWQGGGNMIQDVTFERTVYQPAPARFEAGTGNIADAVGLGAALDWLSQLGLPAVQQYEHALLHIATEKLLAVRGLRMIGTAGHKAGVLSFVLDGQTTETLSGILDKDGIAVRSGHHCAQPVLRRFGVEATVRASLAPYNTVDDIDALCEALHRLQTR